MSNESKYFNTPEYDNRQPKINDHSQTVISEKPMGKGVYYQMRDDVVSEDATGERITNIAKRVMEDVLNNHINMANNAD